MEKSVPRVTVWHHSTESRDAKTMTLGTDLPVRTTHSCQILIFCSAVTCLHNLRHQNFGVTLFATASQCRVIRYQLYTAVEFIVKLKLLLFILFR